MAGKQEGPQDHLMDEVAELRRRISELEASEEQRTAELLKANEQLRREISERGQVEKALRESEERFRSLYEECSQREQLYESLLHSAPDPVAIYNFSGEALYINRAFTETFGFTMEDVQGKLIPFVPESEVDRTRESIRRVLDHEHVSGFETKRLTRDGGLLDVVISSSRYCDHEGKPAGIVVFLRDVTQTKRIEQQLLQAQKMEAVGILAGGIAHDFNNILQAMQGYAELLLLTTKEDQMRHKELMEISRAGKRGHELTRQLLTFSRRVESKLAPMNLNLEVEKVSRLMARTLPKMIAIELRLCENVWTMNADSTQIEQILLNLAVNSAHAMPEGGRLIIETQNVNLDDSFLITQLSGVSGHYVLLTVSDTGHGMDEATLQRIFEPFFSTKKSGTGTGLGLAMTYGIVKSHGGYITCDSKPGEGASFKIYFPAAGRETRPEPKEETEAPMKGGEETILLVDDEDTILDLGQQILTEFGYTVLCANTGEQALEVYEKEKERIHLVILDLMMPGMGGRRCLEELLTLQPDVKVLVASGFSPDWPTGDPVKSGARGFVGKPYKVKGLLESIRDVLDRP